METNKQFKCKDEILLKDKEDKYAKWFYAVFSHYCENISYITISGGSIYNLDFYKILPYEGNEELVGTTDEPDEEIRLEEGEFLICLAKINDFEQEDLLLGKFDKITNSSIRIKTQGISKWHYAIRFSDFNPNDMEETKKHILCVKNGKVVRYKG